MNISNTTANMSKLSISYNNSYAILNNTASQNTNNNKKTPDKQGNENAKKSPGRKSPAPNNTNNGNGSKTPTSSSSGDRFIPNRGATDMELSSFLIKKEDQKSTHGNENDNNIQGTTTEERSKAMSEAVHGLDISKRRILAFQTKAPAPPESHLNPMRVVYSVKTPLSTKSGTRFIPSNPERILDAPDISNDYYLNLLDWSSSNIVTVALGQSVYLWNAGTGNIDILFEDEPGNKTSSLAWIQEGSILGVGKENGNVELWDVGVMRRLRIMQGQVDRVGALTWNQFVLSSGARNGAIVNHDVRVRDHIIQTLNGHTQEICNLKWSPDAKYLASGGNDNIVSIWAAEGNGSQKTSQTPLYTLNEHQAAIRGLAWCPWQPSTLATGGGTADRCIKFWNVNSGTCFNSIETASQITCLLFASNYKELISAHGFATHQLTIWKYPSMTKQIDLTGHTQRILQLALSPDGSTVMSASGDETLRLWKCFAQDPNSTKKKLVNDEKKSIFSKSGLR